MKDSPPTKAPTLVDMGNAKMDGTEIAKKCSKSEQKEASNEDDYGESKGEEFGDDQVLAGEDSSGALEMIRKVAYKWKLPAGTKIHPVFHASCLKQQWEPSVAPASNLPIITNEGLVQGAPMAGYQEECTHRKENAAGVQILRRWLDRTGMANWEDHDDSKAKFPQFHF